ncbi:hypothetical protein TNCV_1083051 [Trichonephila clavipes]|nr:hypothetical protein TNCV_1083051 [Trichonephila clavipes]
MSVKRVVTQNPRVGVTGQFKVWDSNSSVVLVFSKLRGPLPIAFAFFQSETLINTHSQDSEKCGLKNCGVDGSSLDLKDTIRLQTSLPSPGFKPRPYVTETSVTNHQ